ncbi:MAG TPA: helix-turn-helix transcriptional regulator [Tahibacter sp.]|nr:helix-turn-helix transcriptional regulator [Tahibacter sp.]
MPVLTADSDIAEWIDPDLVPRPVVTIGAAGVVLAAGVPHDARYDDRNELDFHRHRKGQLMLALRGVLTGEVEGGFWIVPPLSAIWVPGGVLHKIRASGAIECYIAYVDPAAATKLPAYCCTLSATPLLRELLVRSASLPFLYDERGYASNLVALLLDELALAPVGNLHLPMPADARLRRIVETIMNDPSDRGTMRTWARRVGASERTLARLVMEQTGMSFGRWRQQLHLMLAVRWLVMGASVQRVADDLGYDSASGFVAMFRKVLGTSPGRYVGRRRD